MPTPRKPTALLRLTGGFNRHPERARARENEPEPAGPVGDPPKRLRSKATRVAWAELVTQAPWVTASDRWWMETACRLQVKVQGGKGTAADDRNLMAALKMLGVNPADRSRVQMPKKSPQANKFMKLEA